MSFFDSAVDDIVAPWLYDLFRSNPQAAAGPATVPNSPMANAPEVYQQQQPALGTTEGILRTMHPDQVPNSPMANAPEHAPQREPTADETLSGLLAQMKDTPEGGEHDSDRATNRKIAMLGLGLKAAGELMHDQLRSGWDVQARNPGRGVPSGVWSMHDELEKKRLAGLHPVDWSQITSRGFR